MKLLSYNHFSVRSKKAALIIQDLQGVPFGILPLASFSGLSGNHLHQNAHHLLKALKPVMELNDHRLSIL